MDPHESILAQRREQIGHIEQLRNSRVLALYLGDSASLSSSLVRPLASQLLQLGHQPQVDLWIRTIGGNPDITLQIVSMLRAYGSRLTVLIPAECKSAGTEIALGADQIIMTPFAVLSPVDIQEGHVLLPETTTKTDARYSVLELRQAIEQLKRVAGDLNLDHPEVAGLLGDMLRQIHPLAAGALEGSYQLTKLLTQRILAFHMTDPEQIMRIVDCLCDDYYSHSFPIDIHEAKRLGLNVQAAEPHLQDALWNLLSTYEDARHVPSSNDAAAGGRLIGCLDSTALLIDCLKFSDSESSVWRLQRN